MAGYHLWDNNVIMSDFLITDTVIPSCSSCLTCSERNEHKNTRGVKRLRIFRGYFVTGEIRGFHSEVPKRTDVLISLHAGTWKCHWAKWINVPMGRTCRGEFQCSGMLMKSLQMSGTANVAGRWVFDREGNTAIWCFKYQITSHPPRVNTLLPLKLLVVFF